MLTWLRERRARRYDDAYERAKATRLERERRFVISLQASPFDRDDPSFITTATLPRMSADPG